MTPYEMFAKALEIAGMADSVTRRGNPSTDGQVITGMALLANFYLQAAQVASNYPAWQQQK